MKKIELYRLYGDFGECTAVKGSTDLLYRTLSVRYRDPDRECPPHDAGLHQFLPTMARWEFGEHFRHLASPKAGCSVRDPVGMVSAKEVSDEGNTVQRRTSKELLLKVRQPLSCCPTWHLNACRCPPRSLSAAIAACRKPQKCLIRQQRIS